MTAAQEKIQRWRADPLAFVRDVFQVEPDIWQREALQMLGGTANRRRIGMKSCTGAGKSTLLAWIAWHRLVCFAERGEHPKGIALSGQGFENLRTGLWAELSKWQERSEFLRAAFVWNQERVFAADHPSTWFLAARSYKKDADAEAVGRALSGLHSKFPFVLLDEIGDMPITVGQKAEQIFTGLPKDALIAAAGNPTSTAGLLYQISNTLRELWEIITITADPDDPRRTPRVDAEHAREQIRLYGRDNPWVMATILGEFPPGGLNTLLGLEEVEAAMERNLKKHEFEHAQKRLGIDVARFGDDRTILFPRQGLVAFKPVEMRNAPTNDIAARVALAKSNWGSELEFVDDTGGWGAGVIDSLRQAGFKPRAVNFSSKADDPRYFNKRAEMWFRMADWVKRGGCLPPIRSLVRELTTPTYSFQNGKFRLEEKDQIKKRLQFSPDMGDALALTFAIAEMPARADALVERMNQRSGGYGKILSEWNPLESA